MAGPQFTKKLGEKKEHTLNTRCEPLSLAHFVPLLMSVSITPVKNSFHESIQMPSIPQPRIACCLMVVTCSCKMKDRDSSSTNSKRKQKWAFSIPVAVKAGHQPPLWRKAVVSTWCFFPSREGFMQDGFTLGLCVRCRCFREVSAAVNPF